MLALKKQKGKIIVAKVKWILGKDRMPEVSGDYLFVHKEVFRFFGKEQVYFNIQVLHFCAKEDGGWNCYENKKDGTIVNDFRIDDCYAWADMSSMLEDLGGLE